MATRTCFVPSPCLQPSAQPPPQLSSLPPQSRFPWRTRRSRTPCKYHEPRASATETRHASFSVHELKAAADISPSNNASLPVLVYLPGLDGRALPAFQAEPLLSRYRIFSATPTPGERASWDTLAADLLAAVDTPEFTLLGESFGAALALRVAARAPERVTRLILLNSGTALRSALVARTVARLLPVLRAPYLYRVAARILTPLLADDTHVHPSVSLADGGAALFNVDDAPLADVEYRVNLLADFNSDFNDDCLRDLVHTPTTIVAAAGDHLLPSLAEARRLQQTLPNVTSLVVLPNAPHAALLDSRVRLADLLHDDTPDSADDDDGPATRAAADAGALEYAAALRSGTSFFEPWRRLISPWTGGLSHVREALELADKVPPGRRPRAVLFVGNHGKYGLLDLPLLYLALSDELDKYGGGRLRGLAHASHFTQFDEASGGRWARFVRALGAVPASARAYYGLLRAGERVLLFPGGAREVCRRRGEEYTLTWRETTDFVRPAARFDAVIVPFSSVGADDDCATIIDGQEVQDLPGLGDVVKRALDDAGFDKENLMPIGAPPRMGRYYFQFHGVVDTRSVRADDEVACQKVYDEVRVSVQTGIEELLRRREADPQRSLGARLVKGAMETGREGLEALKVPMPKNVGGDFFDFDI